VVAQPLLSLEVKRVKAKLRSTANLSKYKNILFRTTDTFTLFLLDLEFLIMARHNLLPALKKKLRRSGTRVNHCSEILNCSENLTST
jgi:hypothetical protein